MKIVKASFVLESTTEPSDVLQLIERAGRTAYRSEDKITPDSANEFVRMIIKRGHLSVLEHYSETIRIICDRGVSHEIVRHRLASYTQESTRYCNYAGAKHGQELTFIVPPELTQQAYQAWWNVMDIAEKNYLSMIENNIKPEIARSVLPNSLKTEIVMTCNLREWMHFFTLRTSKAAHPQMREIAIPMLVSFRELFPAIFENVGEIE